MEYSLVLLLLGTSWWFLTLRTRSRPFPSGDEGSWMNVAAQLSRGEGFTTRWYEHPFLTHPYLPRPDDFRYPGLTLILAMAFTVSGLSYSAALAATTTLFLLFLLLYYLIVRKKFGSVTALTSLAITSVSLLQLYWNSAVYTEGLFALVLSILVALFWFGELKKIRTWILIGLAISMLYYVRLNGILFLTGLPVYVFRNRTSMKPALQRAAAALATFLVFSAPWMIRSAVLFGNPLHVAGGAGILRAAAEDPRTWSLLEFITHYSPFFFIHATVQGTIHFFSTLHFFEKNLFIIPLAALTVNLLRTRTVTFLTAGFAATLLACFYIGYRESWAAVRYATALLPFMYAGGVAVIVQQLRRLATQYFPRHQKTISILPALVLLSTLYYPHRFYIRQLSNAPHRNFPEQQHAAMVDSLVTTSRYYFADAYGQVAFLSNRRCIGIQQYVDATLIKNYLEQYQPTLMVLSTTECDDPRIQGSITAARQCGWTMIPVDTLAGGIYFTMRKK